MTVSAGQRLLPLSQRYANAGALPAGESFLNAFKRFQRANRESLLDITMVVASSQILMSVRSEYVDPLLLKAIYDTNPSMTETRLFSLDEEALMGAVNTAKGKYFEYLVVGKLNSGEQVGPLLLHDGQHAVLAESMTQPGWDMQIVDDHGHVINYLQLKATDSISYIHAALVRYPDIQILATHEVGASDLVIDSGISDLDLQQHVAAGVDFTDASLTEAFFDYFNPLLPLALMVGYEGYRLVVGRTSTDAFKLALARRGQRMVASQFVGATVYAIGGGYFSVPAAFAGGLLFDRVINQTAIMDSYKSHQDKLLSLRLMQQEREIKGRLV